MFSTLASFASVMSTIGYVLLALLVLLITITIHEWNVKENIEIDRERQSIRTY